MDQWSPFGLIEVAQLVPHGTLGISNLSLRLHAGLLQDQQRVTRAVILGVAYGNGRRSLASKSERERQLVHSDGTLRVLKRIFIFKWGRGGEIETRI